MEDEAERMRSNALKCRDLAATAITSAARDVLTGLADRYDQEALAKQRSEAAHPRRRPAFKWTSPLGDRAVTEQ
jgi:hypothetical protein